MRFAFYALAQACVMIGWSSRHAAQWYLAAATFLAIGAVLMIFHYGKLTRREK